jgi:hypothetical protein
LFIVVFSYSEYKYNIVYSRFNFPTPDQIAQLDHIDFICVFPFIAIPACILAAVVYPKDLPIINNSPSSGASAVATGGAASVSLRRSYMRFLFVCFLLIFGGIALGVGGATQGFNECRRAGIFLFVSGSVLLFYGSLIYLLRWIWRWLRR